MQPSAARELGEARPARRSFSGHARGSVPRGSGSMDFREEAPPPSLLRHVRMACRPIGVPARPRCAHACLSCLPLVLRLRCRGATTPGVPPHLCASFPSQRASAAFVVWRLPSVARPGRAWTVVPTKVPRTRRCLLPVAITRDGHPGRPPRTTATMSVGVVWLRGGGAMRGPCPPPGGGGARWPSRAARGGRANRRGGVPSLGHHRRHEPRRALPPAPGGGRRGGRRRVRVRKWRVLHVRIDGRRRQIHKVRERARARPEHAPGDADSRAAHRRTNAARASSRVRATSGA